MNLTKTEVKRRAAEGDYDFLVGLLDREAIIGLLLQVPTTPVSRLGGVSLAVLRDAVVCNAKIERLPVSALLNAVLKGIE